MRQCPCHSCCLNVPATTTGSLLLLQHSIFFFTLKKSTVSGIRNQYEPESISWANKTETIPNSRSDQLLMMLSRTSGNLGTFGFLEWKSLFVLHSLFKKMVFATETQTNYKTPLYPLHKSLPVQKTIPVCVHGRLVCVCVCTRDCIKVGSKRSGYHGDEHGELWLEQALRDTSPVFV